jgi:hypothetical protein
VSNGAEWAAGPRALFSRPQSAPEKIGLAEQAQSHAAAIHAHASRGREAVSQFFDAVRDTRWRALPGNEAVAVRLEFGARLRRIRDDAGELGDASRAILRALSQRLAYEYRVRSSAASREIMLQQWRWRIEHVRDAVRHALHACRIAAGERGTVAGAGIRDWWFCTAMPRIARAQLAAQAVWKKWWRRALAHSLRRAGPRIEPSAAAPGAGALHWRHFAARSIARIAARAQALDGNSYARASGVFLLMVFVAFAMFALRDQFGSEVSIADGSDRTGALTVAPAAPGTLPSTLPSPLPNPAPDTPPTALAQSPALLSTQSPAPGTTSPNTALADATAVAGANTDNQTSSAAARPAEAAAAPAIPTVAPPASAMYARSQPGPVVRPGPNMIERKHTPASQLARTDAGRNRIAAYPPPRKQPAAPQPVVIAAARTPVADPVAERAPEPAHTREKERAPRTLGTMDLSDAREAAGCDSGFTGLICRERIRIEWCGQNRWGRDPACNVAQQAYVEPR